MSQPKTLLVVIPSLHLGGAETHLSQILPGLKAKGWDITVYLTSGIGELAPQLEAAGVSIRHPAKLTLKLHNRNKLLRAPLLLVTFLQLLFYLLRKRPSIVHFVLPEAYLIGGLSGILSQQKNMIMSRRSLNNYQQKYPIITKIEIWLHRKMRYIITNSQANIVQLSQLERVPLEKLQLIYNGLDISRFNLSSLDRTAIRQEFKLPDSSLTLIVIANIIPYKGHATLLEALAQIKDKLPADWQLLCIGREYEYVQELQQLAINLNIAKHIHWLGMQTAIEKLLAISNIGISCSYEEGFSNSVIEAMAAGLPTVVTNVGGNAEAVVNDQTGIVVPARDPNALGAAIAALAKDPIKMAQLGTTGKQRVCECFSLQACVDSYDRLYAGL